MIRRVPEPISPAALVTALHDRVLALAGPRVVLVDGAPASAPESLALDLVAAVRTAGRAALHIEACSFWRDASIRLEYGREDLDSYLDWVDAAALRREVIEPLRSARPVLPSLRDPTTNRSTRSEPVLLGDGIVVISGALLLRLDLNADLVIHLAMSAATLQRRTPPGIAWTTPAFARYERDFGPLARSDVVVRCDDPRHPAVVGLR